MSEVQKLRWKQIMDECENNPDAFQKDGGSYLLEFKEVIERAIEWDVLTPEKVEKMLAPAPQSKAVEKPKPKSKPAAKPTPKPAAKKKTSSLKTRGKVKKGKSKRYW